MTVSDDGLGHVRYWAAARAAAGMDADRLEVTGPVSLADVTRRCWRCTADSRLADVICLLLGDGR